MRRDQAVGLVYECRRHNVQRYSTLIASVLAGPLLAATAAGQVLLESPPSSYAASRRHPTPLVTFHWQAGRWLATLDRALLDADIHLTAQLVAVAAPGSSPTSSPARAAAGPVAPMVGERLASGALRLQQVGDSVVLATYVGGAGQGRLHYRRRGATPVLQDRPGQGLVIDAALLWATLAPVPADPIPVWHLSNSGAAARTTLRPARPVHHSAPAVRNGEMVTRRLGDYLVTYAVGVYRLPTIPMRPRIADQRLTWQTISVPWGDSSSSTSDSTSDSTKSDSTATLQVIYRYRLEKRDPAAPVSDVVQPILASLDSVPDRWVPYFTAAIEGWNQVFASLGFRGAIRVLRGTPLPTDSTIPIMRLVFVDGEERVSRSDYVRTDPRSGEALESRVMVDRTNPVEYLALAYSTLLSVRDAKLMPGSAPPDSVLGLLISCAAGHEIGHALGLHHNFQVDGYPTDSLRRPDFVRRMRFVPSLLSYSSLNYVAQPEDGVPLEDRLLLRPGPYDTFALAWGYRPIPEARTPHEELPTLERWRAVQDTVPYLRGQVGASSPYYQPEMMGNDLVKSIGYGLRNLALTAEAKQPQLADSSRGELIHMWLRLLKYVPVVIGGELPRAPYPAKVAETRMESIDSAYQVATMRFLVAHVFDGQDELIRHVLPAAPKDSALVLFDRLLPEWEKSQLEQGESGKEKLQQGQEQILTSVISAQLPALVKQKQLGTLAAVCRELATLERRFVAVSGDSTGTRDRRERATALLAVVAQAFETPQNAGSEEPESTTDENPAPPAPPGPTLCTR